MECTRRSILLSLVFNKMLSSLMILCFWSSIFCPITALKEDVTSNKLLSHIDQVKNIGDSLNMYCKLNQDSTENMNDCKLTRPNGMDEIVVKENGVFTTDEIAGIKIDTSDPNSCNITVEVSNETDLGVWSCLVQLNNTKQFQESKLTATVDGLVDNIRLPRNLVPEHYTIQLTPFIIEDNFTINGHVDIKLVANNMDDVARITLHIRDIEIFEHTVQVTNYDVIGHGYDSSREFYIAYVNRSGDATEMITISMDFVANLDDGLNGFYRSSYEDESGIKKFLAVTQFEASDARKAMPCMDEPNMKAKFSIQLGHLPNMTAISNMPISKSISLTTNGDQYVMDVFEETEKMSTYLLAFVVSDFEYQQGVQTDNDVIFRIWSRSEVLPQTKYAAETGPIILEHYEDYFGVKFPLPKQDMIAIPDFGAGAMENWGLITYREAALLYEEGVSSLMNKEGVAIVMAHELAHQWFGDLVTMDWWTE